MAGSFSSSEGMESLAFGVLFLMIGLIKLRTRVGALRLQDELAPPLPEPSR